MNIQSYPLCWPDGWRRTDGNRRQFGRFNRKDKVLPTTPGGNVWMRTRDVTVADSVERVLSELYKMGAVRDDIIISTNIRTRLDGLPRSNEREPDDPGAAVYWQLSGEAMKCMAVDRYKTTADNLAAIGATLEAMRAIERHGGAEILNRAFRGFAALPEHAESAWRYFFGFGEDQKVSREQIESAFRDQAKKKHPDAGGTDDEFKQLVLIRDNALREVTP